MVLTFAEFRSWTRQAFTNGQGLERAWRAVLLKDPCVYCGAPANGLDHIRPASRRGADDWENRAPACTECDQNKQAAGLLFYLVARRAIQLTVERRRRYRSEQARIAAFRQGIRLVCKRGELPRSWQRVRPAGL